MGYVKRAKSEKERVCVCSTMFIPCVLAHDELKFLDLMSEKNEVNIIPVVDRNTDEKPIGVSVQPPVNVAGRSINRLSASSLLGHHHHHHYQQQNQLYQSRNNGGGSSGGGMIITDYRGESVTTSPAIVLEPGMISSSGCRRPAVNGSVSSSSSICGGSGEPHPPHLAVWHPRPLYPFPLPLPNTTGLWHSSQPPFPTANVAFAPFMEVSQYLIS